MEVNISHSNNLLVMGKLKEKKIAILVTEGFEEVELTQPKAFLENESAIVTIISDKDRIKSWAKTDWGKEFKVDVNIDDAEVDDYDMLLIPGGVINPDKLRRNARAVALVKEFNAKNKLIASICHGPQMLIEAGIVKDRAITSFYSIRTDLQNAGAMWVDSEIVVDRNIITSRNPDDIPAFNKKILEQLEKQSA